MSPTYRNRSVARVPGLDSPDPQKRTITAPQRPLGCLRWPCLDLPTEERTPPSPSATGRVITGRLATPNEPRPHCVIPRPCGRPVAARPTAPHGCAFGARRRRTPCRRSPEPHAGSAWPESGLVSITVARYAWTRSRANLRADGPYSIAIEAHSILGETREADHPTVHCRCRSRCFDSGCVR